MAAWKIAVLVFLGWALLNLVLFFGRWDPERVPPRMLLKKWVAFNLFLVGAALVVGFVTFAPHIFRAR